MRREMGTGGDILRLRSPAGSSTRRLAIAALVVGVLLLAVDQTRGAQVAFAAGVIGWALATDQEIIVDRRSSTITVIHRRLLFPRLETLPTTRLASVGTERPERGPAQLIAAVDGRSVVVTSGPLETIQSMAEAIERFLGPSASET